MKIEIGESLACSWLRHVCQCWIVQANWKFAEHWPQYLTDAELEQQFQAMKSRFDRDGGVFKKTKDARQFLGQGEIDTVGVDDKGVVHAVEVAFHEAGLQYGKSSTETNNRVLKKMLRTLLILRACRPPKTRLNVYFLSPKVNPVVQQPLEKIFAALRDEYPDVKWRFVSNDSFADDVVRPTLEKAIGVADSSELFLRSAKLLNLVGYGAVRPPAAQRTHSHSDDEQVLAVREIQPLVRDLMRTLLVDVPELLCAEDKRGLQNQVYCRQLGLKIGNRPLLRRTECGRKDVKGYDRYWKDSYGGFYVCSEWGRQHHHSNVRSLLAFVEDVAERNKGQPDAKVLRQHEQAFRDYLAGA